MKEIIKPAKLQHEEAEYFCDFKGKPEKAHNFIVITGGYGSDFDLAQYRFELSNESVQKLLKFIADNLQSGDSIEKHDTPYNIYGI